MPPELRKAVAHLPGSVLTGQQRRRLHDGGGCPRAAPAVWDGARRAEAAPGRDGLNMTRSKPRGSGRRLGKPGWPGPEGRQRDLRLQRLRLNLPDPSSGDKRG